MLWVANGVICGLNFYRVGFEAEDDMLQRLTSAFVLVVGPGFFFPMMNSLALLPAAEVMLRRELASGSFRLSAWFATQTSVAMIPEVQWTLVFIPIMYFLTRVGADSPAGLFGFFALTWLSALSAHSLGMLLTMLAGPKAPTVALILLTFCFMFNGVFVPLDEVPLPWLAYANPLYYTLNLLGYFIFTLPDRSYPEEDGGSLSPSDCLSRSSLDVPPLAAAAALSGLAFIFRGSAFFLLRRKLHHRLFVQQSVKGTASGSAAGAPAEEPAPLATAVVHSAADLEDDGGRA